MGWTPIILWYPKMSLISRFVTHFSFPLIILDGTVVNPESIIFYFYPYIIYKKDLKAKIKKLNFQGS